jgi:hypothetical protein
VARTSMEKLSHMPVLAPMSYDGFSVQSLLC